MGTQSKSQIILFAIRSMKDFAYRGSRNLEAAHKDKNLKLAYMTILFERVLKGHIDLITYLLVSNPKDELLHGDKQMMREEIEEVLRNCPSGVYEGLVVTLLTEGPLAENEGEENEET